MLVNFIIRSQFPRWRCSDSIFRWGWRTCVKILVWEWDWFPLRNANIEVVQVEGAWYFFSHEQHRREKGGRKTLIVHGHTWRLKTAERAKAVGDLLPYIVSKGRISYTPSVECIVGWTACKTLPFCSENSGPFWLCHDHMRKDIRLPLRIIVLVQRSLGTRLDLKLWAWSWQSDYIINNCQLFWVVLSGWSLLNLFIVYLIVYWFLLSRRYWISTATNIMSTASSSDSTILFMFCAILR